MRTWLSSLLLLAAVALALAGCPGDPTPPGGGGSDKGSVVAGVSSPLRAGIDIKRLHVRMTVDGATIRDSDVAGAGLKLPLELSFGQQDPASLVEIEVQAFDGVVADPLIVRLASTTVVANRTLLLPVPLETSCILRPPIGADAGAIPVCDAPETCHAGACIASFVDASKLDDYSPSWSAAPDICKPANAGAPTIVVGEGMSDYLPTMDGDVAEVEAGPQGGHHIWVAVRMKNLHQSGSITEVKGYVPDLSHDVPPFKVIFTYDQDEGGYCKLYGLRFQLDTDIDIAKLLGKVVNLTVTVTDSDGDVGVGKRTVTLSNDFIQ